MVLSSAKPIHSKPVMLVSSPPTSRLCITKMPRPLNPPKVEMTASAEAPLLSIVTTSSAPSPTATPPASPTLQPEIVAPVSVTLSVSV